MGKTCRAGLESVPQADIFIESQRSQAMTAAAMVKSLIRR